MQIVYLAYDWYDMSNSKKEFQEEPQSQTITCEWTA